MRVQPWTILALAEKPRSPHAHHVTVMLLQHDLENGYRRVDDAIGKKHWEFWHKHLATGCIHAKSCSRWTSSAPCTPDPLHTIAPD